MTNTGLKETLQSLLDKYKKNINGVSEQDFCGKYHKAFQRLEVEISEAARNLAFSVLVEPFALRAGVDLFVVERYKQIVQGIIAEGLEKTWKSYNADDMFQTVVKGWDTVFDFIILNKGAVKGYGYKDHMDPESYNQLFNCKSNAVA